MAAGALASTDLLGMARAWAQTAQWKPEAGAKLNILRWKRFVEAEDKAFMAMVDAFSKANGVEITISNESYEDVQPKAAVAANTGQGLDMVWGLYSLPHLFPDKCMDMADVATYLGGKYGGWAPSGELYGKSGSKWICVPVAITGGLMNYRISSIEKAGFKEFPKDTDGFLELCKGLKKNNTPAGFALGHFGAMAATSSTKTIRWPSIRPRPPRRSNMSSSSTTISFLAPSRGTTHQITRRFSQASCIVRSMGFRSTLRRSAKNLRSPPT
jgi:multiple sugar transport system substrate-binding protein